MATMTDSTATEPAFIVERFAASGDRVEVSGHWLGLRGRHLVRPVLWLHRGESRERLVAVLDHKPWAAEDGEPWLAAFKWNGGKLDAERAELEVGRELVVELPLPGRAASKPRPARARVPTELERAREELLSATKERTTLQAALDVAQAKAEELARTRDELARAREDADRARADGERMVNDEYRQRESALAAAEEATGRAREAESALRLAERQLEAARAAYAELESARDRLAAQLDSVRDDTTRAQLAARVDELEAERDALAARAGELEAERDALAARPAEPVAPVSDPAELAAAREQAERLERELAGAWRERDQLTTELTAARAGRERVEAELVAARADRKRLERERERLESEVASPARRAPRAASGESRLAPPKDGMALWGVRLVALSLVAILLGAVAVLLTNVL